MLIRPTLLALTLALASCGDPGPLAAPSPAASPRAATQVESPREGHTSFNITVRLQMVISGDTELGPISTEAELTIVEIFQGKNPREVWFYSVSPAKPVESGEGRLMLFSADLAPGIYEGPGRYELSDKAGVTVAGKEGLSSGAYVMLYRQGGPDVPKDEIVEAFRRYEKFGEPCTLVVTPQSLTGTVDCPSLLDDKGNSVELHWNWARI